MELELVISDLDGTIVETENYHRLAYNELFKELGVDTRWSKQDYAHRLQTMGGNKFREIFSWLNLPENKYEQSKQRLYARKTELYVELITHDLTAGQLRIRPGIQRLFKEVQDSGIPIAIGTACVGWAAQKVVQAALGEAFLQSLACLCGGESTPKHKPAPDIYLLVAQKVGVHPESCVVIEDTHHGLQSAKRAGMTCLATPSEFAAMHDFSEADLVLPDLNSPSPFNLKSLRDLLLKR